MINLTTILLYFIQAVFIAYFRNFKRLNRAEHDASDFKNDLEYEGENCYIPSGNGRLLEFFNFIFIKDFTKDYLDFKKSYKRRNNVIGRCRNADICESTKQNFEYLMLKAKKYFLGPLRREMYV